MSNKKRGIPPLADDPKSFDANVSEALRTAGASVERFNAQFLAGMAKISDAVSRPLATNSAAFDGALGKFDDTARAMAASGNALASGLQKSFHTLFDTEFKGELRSAESSWKGFCNSLENVFFRTLSKLAASGIQQIFKGVFNWISGGSEFFGGGEFSPVSTMLDGASPSGSRSFSPSKTSLQIQVNIENQTGTPVKAEQGPVRYDMEKAVVSVVLKNYNEGGSIWQMIRGEKGK